MLAACVAPFAIAVVVGLVVLWPKPIATPRDAEQNRVDLYDATVVSTKLIPCALGTCESVVVQPSEGPEAGQPYPIASFALDADVPQLNIGDALVVQRSTNPQDGSTVYNFADMQRQSSLVWLAILFAVVVVAVARLRGLAALIGLGFSYLVIVRFLLPGLLDGKSPIAVALVAAGAIMFVILYLAHGFNARTTTALLGTMVSLVLIGVLSQIFVSVASLSGLTSDEATYVKAQIGNVDLRGILLAGIIIGALGVLNDVTVTQSSAIWEIHTANPTRGRGQIYRSGMRVGRDHIASTVDTLVLAYAGASLPLFIVFSLAAQPLSRIVTGSLVAEEVVRTLVGSIGLVASVPVTTAIATLVVVRTAHAHAHQHDEHHEDGESTEPAVVIDDTATGHLDEAPVSVSSTDERERGEDSDEGDRDDDADPDGTSSAGGPSRPPKEYRVPKGERDFWSEG